MSTKITLDPVTRIEGHLKVSLDVEGSTVTRAYSSGTSFRGFEPMLSGRDARDAAQIVMRMCGACHVAHGRTGLEALESIAGATIPNQARLLRNIIQAANFIESHLLHFYAMGLPDFVSELPTVGSMTVTDSLLAVGREGSLDESVLRDHAAQAISIRRACYELIALLGGKIPHPSGLILGGTTVFVTKDLFDSVQKLCETITGFTSSIPEGDVELLATAYPTYESLGETGCGHLAHGCFPDRAGNPMMKKGFLAADSATVASWDDVEITESTASSKLAGPSPLAPFSGVTEPDLSKSSAYTFAKAPRLAGKPFEVGALSRALVNGSTPAHRGVWARYRARAAEARLLSAAIATWLTELEIDVMSAPEEAVTLGSGQGFARGEAPRGALGHWVVLEEGRDRALSNHLTDDVERFSSR
ncbi:MAG: nickel-dependent hydrogenase large subunit [Polyangiaceae bacterium]